MDTWAAREFVGCELPDARFHTSLAKNAEALATHSGDSFSVACGDDGRQSARRLFRHKGTSLNGLMKGHFEQTAARCSNMPLVIAAMDSMILEYTGHHALTGIGPITTSGRGRGLVAHSVLGMSPTGEPYGLLSLEVWARKDRKKPKRDERRRLPTAKKESNKWLVGLRSIARVLPPGQEVLIVADREADIYDLFAARRRSTIHLLIRSNCRRRVEVDPGDIAETIEITKMSLAIEKAPVAGQITLDVQHKPGQPQRQAKMSVQFQCMSLMRPIGSVYSKSPAQLVSVIRVAEIDPPDGIEPIIWVLLSTMPVTDFESACQMVHYYELRWTIERLHFTLKSGCLNVERVQIDDGAALINALALYYIVAWRVLHLTYLARTKSDEPATAVLSVCEMRVLEAAGHQPVLTVGDAMRQIAILAGHPHYANAPTPGVKRLCRGMLILLAMVAGWELARNSTDM
jgi:hypothetical protein